MAPKISSWVIPTELSDAILDINSGESGNLTFRATFSDLNDDATPRFDSRFLFLTWRKQHQERQSCYPYLKIN